MTASTASKHAAKGPPGIVASEGWRWTQSWRQVQFVHWPVSPESLERRLPPGLEVDTWLGQGYVSIVAFRLEWPRWRNWPLVGSWASLTEINFRTYVRHGAEKGIYFLGMFADHWLATRVARRVTPLPYRYARISTDASSDPPLLRYRLSKRGSGPSLLADMEMPTEERACAIGDILPMGAFDDWLLERYSAFVPRREGGLMKMDAAHAPWRAWRVAPRVCASGMGRSFGLDTDSAPGLAHYSPGVEAVIYPFVSLGPADAAREANRDDAASRDEVQVASANPI